MKTNNGKYYFTAIVLMLSVNLSVLAQNEARHEVSFWGALGSSALNVDMNKGKGKGSVNGAFGLGYAFNISNRWSVVTGAEVMPYSSKLEAVSITDQYVSESGVSHNFNMGYHNEKIDVNQLNIPLMLQFRRNVDDQQFYLAIGGKVGLPFSPKSESEASSFVSREGFPPRNVSYDIPITEHDIELKMAYMLAAEIGIGWRLSDKWQLQTGVYLDYGLNNILKQEEGRRLIDGQDEVGSFKYNSILTSQYREKDMEKDEYFASKMTPFSFGVKMKLSFSIDGSNSFRGKSGKINYDNYGRSNSGSVNGDWFREYFKSKGYLTEDEMRKFDLPTLYRMVEEQEAKTMKIDKEELKKKHMAPDVRKKMEELEKRKEEEEKAAKKAQEKEE